MNNTICLDKQFSTTRLITKKELKNPSNQSVVFLLDSEGHNCAGGMRTQGYLKQSYDKKPLISIITVVFNGEKHLQETIQSVINQTYDNVEYIIIDGGSTDETLNIIKEYEHRIDYWLSTKDQGIYDAMNKGIDIAQGMWLNFMNAGDTFYDKHVLENIFYQNTFEDIDIIYGNHRVIYPYKTRIVKAGKIHDLWKGSQFCHQSAFISSSFHKKNKYTLHNKIGADFEFFYKSYQNKALFQYVEIIVANYAAGGISDLKRIDSIVSRWNIIEKNNIISFYYILIIIKEISKNYIKVFLLKLGINF